MILSVALGAGCIAPLGSYAVSTPTASTRGLEDGLRVCDVAPNGPARQAGLQREDRLLTIDGQPLASFDALAGALQARQPGTEITLSFRRGPADLSAIVRLGERDGRAYLGLTGCT